MKYRYYHPDKGANDEGYYYKYCPVERCETEHEDGECISCWEREASIRRRLDKQSQTS